MKDIKEFIEKAIEGGWKYDKEDLHKLAKHSWNPNEKGYLVATINYKRVKMHHLIYGKPLKGYVTDHINRNPLDNRRINLRFVTPQENRFNAKARGFRKRGKKWDAQIMLDREQIHLGTFDTPEEAHQAYLQAKEVYHKI